MATQGVLGAATLKEFEDGLHGEMIRPGDGAYDEARSIWNGAHDARPAVIARCADSSDVRHAVGFARSEGLDVAVRGGSHSIPGFSTCDEGIVIDLSPMKGITVDVSGRTATAEGGLTWGELDAATQEHGLATTGGLISTTGVAGFTLGGGIGWLKRKCGLACDNLRSAEVLTADGQILTASATENPDLFWGLRGGGGNFGVVTAFEFDLHPVGPTVAAGPVFYPGDRAEEVMRFYREFIRELPDKLMARFHQNATSPSSEIHIQHFGGAIARVGGDESAYGERQAPFVLNAIASTHEPSGLETHIDWAQQFYGEIEPSLTGGAYINFLSSEGPDRVQAAYGTEKFARLRALKDRYDPTNLFHLNQNIPPS